jgi:hypothetical protein
MWCGWGPHLGAPLGTPVIIIIIIPSSHSINAIGPSGTQLARGLKGRGADGVDAMA